MCLCDCFSQKLYGVTLSLKTHKENMFSFLIINFIVSSVFLTRCIQPSQPPLGRWARLDVAWEAKIQGYKSAYSITCYCSEGQCMLSACPLWNPPHKFHHFPSLWMLNLLQTSACSPKLRQWGLSALWGQQQRPRELNWLLISWIVFSAFNVIQLNTTNKTAPNVHIHVEHVHVHIPSCTIKMCICNASLCP